MKDKIKCARCESDYADYYYKDKYSDEIICEDCLLECDGITSATVTYYYLDGEYMGNDECYEDLIETLCDNLMFEQIDKEDDKC